MNAGSSPRLFEIRISIRKLDDTYEVELERSDPNNRVRPRGRSLVSFNPEELLALQTDHEAYGLALTDQLLPPGSEVRGRFMATTGAANEARAGLRVVLDIHPTAGAIEGLRWELLRHPDKSQAPLATSERVRLSRFLESTDERRVELRRPERLRSLIAVAAPSDLADRGLAAIDYESERDRAAAALATLGESPRTLGGPGDPCTIERLAAMLRAGDGVDVLYLACHGALGRTSKKVSLYLEDEDGETARIKASVLAQTVAALEHPPRLVVLASCESGGADGEGVPASVARALAEAGVAAIVAMQGRITMKTVAAMMPVFFEELGRDGCLDRAMAVARGDVRGRHDVWMPALFTRLVDGQLWVDAAHGAASASEAPSAKPKAAPNEVTGVGFYEGPRGLPARPVSRFRGRRDELSELEHLLQTDLRTVCVVATGLGGVGKTALAEEFVATRAPVLFPAGSAWLSGDELVSELGRLARRFGWSHQREPTPDEALTLVSRELHTKPFLVVVDSFDIEMAHADHIPMPGGQCRTLVTSRFRPLASQLGAGNLELKLWPLQDCRDYMREGCPRLGSTPDGDLDALGEFVGRLPLGVRLLVSVLSHRRSMSASALLQKLQTQPLGSLDRFESDRGVAATFQASFELLSDNGRKTLQALAVCAKHTRIQVVQSVAEIDDVGETLDDLHARSLTEFVEGAHAPWSLHDVVRMFVLEQPGRQMLEAAHTMWVRNHVKKHGSETHYTEYSLGVAEVTTALERLVKLGADDAYSIYIFLEGHFVNVSRFPEAISLSDRMNLATWLSPEQSANVSNNLGICHQRVGNIHLAIKHHKHSHAIAESSGSKWERAAALANLGTCYESLGRLEQSAKNHREALVLFEELEKPAEIASTLANLGNCYLHLGRYDDSIELAGLALSTWEDLGGHISSRARQLGNIGAAHFKLGRFDIAIKFYEQAESMIRQTGNLDDYAKTLVNLGACQRQLGNRQRAIETFGAAFSIFESIPNLQGMAHALANQGFILAIDGDPARARHLCSRAHEMFQQVGLPDEHPQLVKLVRILAALP